MARMCRALRVMHRESVARSPSGRIEHIQSVLAASSPIRSLRPGSRRDAIHRLAADSQKGGYHQQGHFSGRDSALRCEDRALSSLPVVNA